MTSFRKGREPRNPKTSDAILDDLPDIAALFLIHFDIKAGYLITWKRSITGIELDGVVEYKSLPSGLHTVREDLVYFVHREFAGLSAFVNVPADEESRNARMLAVGVMVPLGHGRLGKIWQYAEKLKYLANDLAIHTERTEILEEFWLKHQPGEDSQGDPSLGASQPLENDALNTSRGQTINHNGNQSAFAESASIAPVQALSAFHPAWSLTQLIDTLGPLVFPIYRAALLQKRILITTHAPIQEACDFVYNISIMSSISSTTIELLPSYSVPRRLKPLFAVGVPDIPFLETFSSRGSVAVRTDSSERLEYAGERPGWIACTTDSILATKGDLYDVLISLPPESSQYAVKKIWPQVKASDGTEIRATQRDLTRFKMLRKHLSIASHEYRLSRDNTLSLNGETATSDGPLTGFLTTQEAYNTSLELPGIRAIVESTSWSALAYDSFLWWASAGEQRPTYEGEIDGDMRLLDDISPSAAIPHTEISAEGPSVSTLDPRQDSDKARQITSIVTYFHRLNTKFFNDLKNILDSSVSEDSPRARTTDTIGQRDDTDAVVILSSRDLVTLGIDMWSKSDRLFIENMVQIISGKKLHIEGANIDICGIRIC